MHILYSLSLLLHLELVVASPIFAQPSRAQCNQDDVYQLFLRWRLVAEPWCHGQQPVFTATTTVTYAIVNPSIIHRETVTFVTSTATAVLVTKTVRSNVAAQATSTSVSTIDSTIATVETSDTTVDTETSYYSTAYTTETDITVISDVSTSITTFTTTSTTTTAAPARRMRREEGRHQEEQDKDDECNEGDKNESDPWQWLHQYGADRCHHACSCLIDETRTKTTFTTAITKTLAETTVIHKKPITTTKTLPLTETTSTIILDLVVTSLTTTTSTLIESDTLTLSLDTTITSTTVQPSTTEATTTTTTTTATDVVAAASPMPPLCFRLEGQDGYSGMYLQTSSEVGHGGQLVSNSAAANTYYSIVNGELQASQLGAGGTAVVKGFGTNDNGIEQVLFDYTSGDYGDYEQLSCSLAPVDNSIPASGFELSCTTGTINDGPLSVFRSCTLDSVSGQFFIGSTDVDNDSLDDCDTASLGLSLVSVSQNCCSEEGCDYTS